MGLYVTDRCVLQSTSRVPPPPLQMLLLFFFFFVRRIADRIWGKLFVCGSVAKQNYTLLPSENEEKDESEVTVVTESVHARRLTDGSIKTPASLNAA